MYRRKCKECGTWMEFRPGVRVKLFCSKRCSDIHKEKIYNGPGNGPAMPPLEADKVTDEGYLALVKAMVSRASQDVTKYAPGTQIRESAVKFFQSEHFVSLTGLEGEPILTKLQEEYKRKHKNKNLNYPTSKVRCLENGMVYESIKAAADVFGISPKMLYNVCKGFNKTAAGMHWEYVDEGAV